jgi:hypothetical protein
MIDFSEKQAKRKPVCHSKAEYAAYNEHEMAAQEKYKTDRQRKPDENIFGEKLECFALLKQETVQPCE